MLMKSDLAISAKDSVSFLTISQRLFVSHIFVVSSFVGLTGSGSVNVDEVVNADVLVNFEESVNLSVGFKTHSKFSPSG